MNIWTDYYIKAPTRQHLHAALPAEWMENDLPIPSGTTYALDEIGIIYTEGTFDASGDAIVPPVATPGWYANLRLRGGDIPPALADYLVPAPETPERVFF